MPNFLLPIVLTLASLLPQPAAPQPRDRAAADALGWELGTQAWTFRDRTAFEAIDTARALGLTCIELYPGQPLAKEHPDAKVGPDLTKGQLDALRSHLSASGIRARSFGVCGFNTDEAAARAIFGFVQAMGMEAVNCEPEPEAWDLVERLSAEYGVRVAIHDHPKPSRYWHPDKVLEFIKDRPARLGACADTGHWTRSGLVPVECMKLLEGRIVNLHFKDIKDGEDQPWGTGGSDARGIMAELKRQGFKGVVLVEYETGAGAELEANVRKCIEFFDRTAAELAKEDEPTSSP